MSLTGKKTCTECAVKLSALDVLKVSLGPREIHCKSCGAEFEFSDRRKWIAIMVVIMIVFAPTTDSVFETIPYVTGNTALVIKYILALILFVMINGRKN